MTTATAPFAPAAVHLHQIKFARGATNTTLQGIPADKMCVIPPGCGKNALWIMAHLASTDDYLLTAFDGQTSAIPESWQKLFGMNSTPSSDSSQYPPVDQVRRVLDDCHARVMKWLGSLTAEQLAKPMPKEWQAYAPTLGDVASFAAWHEGYHAGQLSAVRKGLGLPAAFG